MILKNELNSFLIKISYSILTTYFYLFLINFNFFNTNILLLAGIMIGFIGFLVGNSIHILRFLTLLTILVIISIRVLYFNYFFPNNDGFDYTFLYVIYFLLIMGDIEIKKLVKVSFYTQLILLFATIIFYKLGVITSVDIYREGVIRHSLGFSHPNLLGVITMCLTSGFLYIYNSRINLIGYLLIIIINLFAYNLTLSRSAIFCSLLIILVSMLFKYSKILDNKSLRFILIISIPIIFFINIYLPFSFNNSNFYFLLDKVFTGRLLQGHYYVHEYGMTIFGQPIADVSNIINSSLWIEKWVLDSSYLRILLQEGLLIFIAVFSLVLIKIYNLLKGGYSYEVYLLIICLLYASFERYSFNIFYCSIPLFLFIRYKK